MAAVRLGKVVGLLHCIVDSSVAFVGNPRAAWRYHTTCLVAGDRDIVNARRSMAAYVLGGVKKWDTPEPIVVSVPLEDGRFCACDDYVVLRMHCCMTWKIET